MGMNRDVSALAGFDGYLTSARAIIEDIEAKTAALVSAAQERREVGASVHDRDEAERPVFDDEAFDIYISTVEKFAEEALKRELAAFFLLPQATARRILTQHGFPAKKGHFVLKKGKPTLNEEIMLDEKGNFRPANPKK